MTATEIIETIKVLSHIVFNPGFYPKNIVKDAENKLAELIDSIKA